jgi:hypothetical protein
MVGGGTDHGGQSFVLSGPGAIIKPRQWRGFTYKCVERLQQIEGLGKECGVERQHHRAIGTQGRQIYTKESRYGKQEQYPIKPLIFFCRRLHVKNFGKNNAIGYKLQTKKGFIY